MTETTMTRQTPGVLTAPKTGLIVVAVLLAALIAVPVAVGDEFVYHIFITICIFAALSTAWNIVGGYAGQLSLGHAIFYGIGGYAGVILVNLGVSPWIGMFVGAVHLHRGSHGDRQQQDRKEEPSHRFVRVGRVRVEIAARRSGTRRGGFEGCSEQGADVVETRFQGGIGHRITVEQAGDQGHVGEVRQQRAVTGEQ